MKVFRVFTSGGAAYGLERNVFSTISPLTALGVKVRVIAIAEMRSGGLGDTALARLRESCCPFDVIQTHRRVPLDVARKLANLIRTDRPDIVHSHGYKADIASVMSRAKVARVATVHGWCSRSAKERFYEWIGIQALKRMDAVIALCEDYRQRLVRRGVRNECIHVVPVGTRVEDIPSSGLNFRHEWRVRDDEVLIVQVGRLSPEKNPRLLLDAALRICAKHANARFAFVGDGSMTERLRADAAPLGDRVVFAGYMRDVGDVYRAANIVANTSNTEALPRTLLEAGIMGVPVVATNVGGAAEIIEDGVTGILCPPGDVGAISAALTRLIEDTNFRTRAGAAARERVGTLFSIAACGRRLLEVYEAVIARRKGAGP